MKPGVLVHGRFEVEALAASGGMGRVYRARDKSTGALVALKVVEHDESPERAFSGHRMLERFTREARLLAQLQHPAIVRFVAFGATDEGDPYLAMEWLDGSTLSERLARGALSLAEAVDLAKRIAGALAAAHAVGVVHRDLKPSNLFLVDGDVAGAKLIDFGIARLGPLLSDVTRPGSVIGTPGYMAPEQARGLVDIDARADVYALGCVLYRSIAGKLPFEGDDPLAVLAKILLQPCPRLRATRPEVPPALDLLVTRMLSKDPAGRPADGTAVLAEIERFDRATLDERSRTEPPGALTEGEQRYASIVVIARQAAYDSLDSAPTASMGGDGLVPARIQNAAARYGARVEWLADGSLVAVLSSRSGATDQAARTARCALALRDVLPTAAMALATGRAEVSAGMPTGEVIERAARLLKVARNGCIAVDAMTGTLLEGRFELVVAPAPTASTSGPPLELLAEHEQADLGRRLLGRPTPCVGRERDLRTLIAVFQEAVTDEVARAVLVTGPPGIGKSRLRQELERELVQLYPGARIFTARGEAMSAGAPFGMIARALRRGLGIAEADPVDRRQALLRERVEEAGVAEPERERVTEFLAELVGAPIAGGSAQLVAARQDPLLMSDQIGRAWEDLVAALGASGPTLFVLEDLHWGDVPSVRLVDAALGNGRSTRLLALALARPEVEAIFPRLWEGRDVLHVRLAPLTPRQSERLAVLALGDRVGGAKIARIVERAAGNPFFLEELVRAAAEGLDALPETVLAMVQARLEEQGPSLRRVLRAASVYGQTFWRGGVAALLGEELSPSALGTALADLIRRELLLPAATSRFAGEQEYRFRHELVREGSYAMLTERDKKLGHALAARWLEAAGESTALVLAEHWERGGELEAAVSWNRRAAEQALEGNDFAAVIARAERGMACGARGEVRGALLFLEAEAHRWQGSLDRAGPLAREATRLLPPHSPVWYDAVSLHGMASFELGELDVARGLAEELVAFPAGSEPPPSFFVAVARIAQFLLFAGRTDEATALLERVRPLESSSVGRADGALAQARAGCALVIGDFAESLKQCERMVAMARASGDVRRTCLALQTLGNAELRAGRFDRGEAALRGSVEAAEKVHLRGALGSAMHNLGAALARRGALEEAVAVEREAIDLVVAAGNRRIEAASRAELARMLAALGDVDAAEDEARAAIAIKHNAQSTRAAALTALAQVLLLKGRAAEALVVVREAKELADGGAGVDDCESLMRLLHVRALVATGDREAARATLEEARARLEARSLRITDAELRRCFLERVPENAETLSLSIP